MDDHRDATDDSTSGGATDSARSIEEAAALPGSGGSMRDARGDVGTTEKLKLTRLKIHKWRNVAPGTEIHFGEGIHALLGKNGSGKTTLLKLISMCVRVDFRDVRAEEFDIEYELSSRRLQIASRITNEVSRKAPRDNLFVRLAPEGRDALLEPSYRLQMSLFGVVDQPIDFDGTPGRTTVNGRVLPYAPQDALSPFRVDLLLVVWAILTEILDSESPAFYISSPSKSLTVAGVGHFLALVLSWLNEGFFRFDEASGMLSLWEGTSNGTTDGAPRLGIRLVPFKREENHFGRWIPPELVRFVEERLEHDSSPVNEIAVTGENVSCLRRFTTLAGFAEVSLILSLHEKMKKDEHDVYEYQNAKFLIQLKNGDIISHDRLSFGQRRLLSFLYYAACNRHTLIVDELTNGLHHEWIEACVDELAKRQSFVATQNPLLIDYLPVVSADDAETAFIQCRLVEKDGKQWMEWRNTSPDEAERFWKSYSTGVQYISEILRTEGLW